MANTRNIVDAILQEDLFTAKKLINESLLQKLGNALEEKLVDFAPTVFNEGSKPDFLDLDKDGNKKEPMKKAAKEANEDIEIDEDMENIVESFEAELSQLIEEIENETGDTLTEEEIAEIANEFLDTLSEENEFMEELTEDESMEETEEEEKDDGVEEDEGQDVPYQRTIGGVDY